VKLKASPRVPESQSHKGLIFVVSGPSGSGKTTLLEKLLKDAQLKKKGLVKSVSFTTRPKRSGERQGRDYFFISDKEFKRRRKAKKIIEWTRYLGYYYATPKDFLRARLKAKGSVLLCLDFRGGETIKRLYPGDTVTIFIKPPSLGALRQRIEGRCRRTKAPEVDRRLKIAQGELACGAQYDYCLLNKHFQRAAGALKRIILKEINFRL